MDILDPILKPYGQSPYSYIDNVVFSNRTIPVPWAFVCLDSDPEFANSLFDGATDEREKCDEENFVGRIGWI